MEKWQEIYVNKASIKDISIQGLLKVQPDSAYIFYTDSYWVKGKPVLAEDGEFTPEGYLFLKDAQIFSLLKDSTLPAGNSAHMRLAVDKITAFRIIDAKYL